MNLSQWLLVPVLGVVGFLAYWAYRGVLDVERIIAVVVFLVIAVPLGIFTYRLGQGRRER